MLALSSLGSVIITMKNGLVAHGLFLYMCAPASVCVQFNHPACTHPPVTGLRLSLNSPRENRKQSEANCRAAAACLTQVEGEVPYALAGRSLPVSEQPLADGCEAEMIHTDSTVSGALP